MNMLKLSKEQDIRARFVTRFIAARELFNGSRHSDDKDVSRVRLEECVVCFAELYGIGWQDALEELVKLADIRKG